MKTGDSEEPHKNCFLFQGQNYFSIYRSNSPITKTDDKLPLSSWSSFDCCRWRLWQNEINAGRIGEGEVICVFSQKLLSHFLSLLSLVIIVRMQLLTESDLHSHSKAAFSLLIISFQNHHWLIEDLEKSIELLGVSGIPGVFWGLLGIRRGRWFPRNSKGILGHLMNAL